MAKQTDDRLFQVFAATRDGPGVCVSLNLWANAVNKPPAMGNDKTIYALTPETFSLEQFVSDVDELIAQLDVLKQEATGIFAAKKPSL